jgi:succinate dehydrogenase/fumarate reductase cytochrome b subunit
VPALLGIYFFINLESEALSVKERLKRVDWGGIVILTGSLISLLYGVLGTIVFLFYEWKIGAEPMIPLRIFGNRTAGSAYVSCFVLGFVLWAMQYYLILYVSKVSQGQQVRVSDMC